MENSKAVQKLLDRLSLAKEARKAKGDRCLGQREMKLMTQINDQRVKELKNKR